MEKYDLTVAYRIYPEISRSPAVFSSDKYKLSEFCLKSFKESLGDLNVKMIVLLDGCPPTYEELFLKYFDVEDIDFIRLDGVGNLQTFGLQIEILLNQNYSEIVYFAEDDYFYFPNQFTEMVEFLKENSDVDFVTPYDHLDYYTQNIHKNKKSVKVLKNRQWKTVSSTCLTFLTTKNTLKETEKIFSTYQKGNSDFVLWLSLTKSSLKPIILIKSIKLFTLEIFYKILLFTKNQTLLGKNWKLWAPTPTIATHLEKSFLSPDIDWEEIWGITFE